jgi:hydrogenase maturation protease
LIFNYLFLLKYLPQAFFMKTLVIGVGQFSRGDDSVGLEVVKAWSVRHPERADDVKIILCDTPGMDLLDSSFGDYEAIFLVDAIIDPPNPGKITLLEMNELESSITDQRTTHGLGVLQSIKIMEVLNKKPIPPVTVIGISGKHFSLGSRMTTEVKKAIPIAVETLDQLVQALA